MDEQYRQWRRKILDAGPTLSASRVTYDDFRASVMQGDDGGQLLDYVNSKVIFQAGVDFESRPMVVFCACGLPPSSKVDYDRLLNLIIFRLDQFVENDYTVVMLTSGMQHSPGWAWLGKAYRRLDRKYRKNVKRVYVVHPSAWSKLVFQVLGKLVSPKFFAKVTWVDTLSQLAQLVPLAQISVPAAVHEYNAKVDATSGIGRRAAPSDPVIAAADRPVFGVALADEVLLPAPVRESIAHLRRHGVATEGVFRRSPASHALRAAKDAYNRRQHVDLAGGVHVAAVLLKVFFRELPAPLFGTDGYAAVRALPPPSTGERAAYVADVVLAELSRASRRLLCCTCALLAAVARNSAVNRMTAANLAVVWAPNLARSASPMADVAMCAAGPASATVGSVVLIMITEFDRVFAREIADIAPNHGASAADAVLDVVDAMAQEGESWTPA
ncbi:hypothetical protein GGI04_005197 [Coemansia thaxteri]|nr:hypothetical protein GGI04_005197 [Coemansia thaxteri]